MSHVHSSPEIEARCPYCREAKVAEARMVQREADAKAEALRVSIERQKAALVAEDHPALTEYRHAKGRQFMATIKAQVAAAWSDGIVTKEETRDLQYTVEGFLRTAGYL